MRKTYDAVLVVDSGDMFHNSRSIGKTETETVEARNLLFIDAMNKQEADAYGIGDFDLSALGVDKLKELAKRAKFPFLCANLTDANGAPVFKPYIVTEKAGFRIGIFAIVHGGAKPKEAGTYTLQPPIDTAKKYTAALEKEGVDAIVLLAHLTKQDATSIAAEVRGIDLMLGGQSMGFSRYLEPLGTAWWADGGYKGKFVNLITLHFHKKGHTTFVVREQGAKIKQEIAMLDSRIRRYVEMSRAPERFGTRMASRDRFKGFIESLLKQRQTLAEKVKGLTQANPDAPFLTFESISLNRERSEDEEIARWVEEFEKAHPGAGTHGAAGRTGTTRRIPPENLKAIRTLPRPESAKPAAP